MKIKANNANSPIWKDVYSHSMLPETITAVIRNGYKPMVGMEP
mgnify:CR=1 FL=1